MTSCIRQWNATSWLISVRRALAWGLVKLVTAEHFGVISQQDVPHFLGARGRVHLQRAICLQPQVVRAVLKRYGALLKTLQVSEKWGSYLKLWLHQRDFRFCISLPVCQVLKWSWCSFMGVIDCNLSIGAQCWHVCLGRTNQAIFEQLLLKHFSHSTFMKLVDYGVGEITGNSLSNSQFSS